VRAPPTGATRWLDIYTDGNHFKGRKKDSVGYGIWCRHEDAEYGLAQRVDPDHMEHQFKMPRAISDGISNPTMELCAVVHTLMLISDMPAGRHHLAKGSRVVRIYSDYVGPSEWIHGRWQARKPYIRHLVDMARAHLDRINARGIFVQFVHVKGHSNDAGNDAADALSKGQRGDNVRDVALLFS
jgi:ribonuclease HI